MPKARHEAVRTCVACRQEGPKTGLIRIVGSPGGSATVDPTGHAPGRGAYLHRQSACVETAKKRRQVERALGVTTTPDFWAGIASV